MRETETETERIQFWPLTGGFTCNEERESERIRNRFISSHFNVFYYFIVVAYLFYYLGKSKYWYFILEPDFKHNTRVSKAFWAVFEGKSNPSKITY